MPPALLPAIAVLAGSIAGTFSDGSFQPPVPLALFPVAAAVAWWRHAPRLTLVLTLLAFAVGSSVLAADSRQRALYSSLRAALDDASGGFLIDDLGPERDHDPITIRAVLTDDAALQADYVSLRADLISAQIGSTWRRVEGGVAFAVSGEGAIPRAEQWRAGRIIEAPATFRRPARYLNDGVPDMERDLALDGMTLFGSIKSGLLVQVASRGSPLREWAGDVRVRVRGAVRRWIAVHSPTAAAIVTAVLIGDRTGLSDETNERLQRAGTYHVIAISGGNIAILVVVTLGLLVLVGGRGRAGALLTIGVLAVYAQVASSGPSVWRATAMAILYLAARTLDHRTQPWQAITLAAAVMVVVAPLDVRNTGFLLTFGATCALVGSARWISPGAPEGAPYVFSASTRTRGNVLARRMLLWLAASVAASVAVEIVLMPVAAQSFSRVTLAGPVLNFAAVPLMAVAQVAGLIVTAFDAVPPIAGPAGWLAARAAAGIVESARLVDVAPALSWRVPPPGAPLLIAYYATLLAAVLPRRRAVRVLAAAVLAMILLRVAVGSTDRHLPVHGVRLTMIDVGQGEGMLLESGSDRLLIDAGGVPFGSGSFDVGARVIAPALWARGIRTADTLLVTHGDPDHIGGAPVILETFTPGQLWEGVVVPRHGPSRRLRELAQSAGTRATVRRSRDVLRFGRAQIRVLHPPEPDWERPRVRNDDSVVLEVLCGDVALLLTGDAGADVEREIVPMLTPARTRILKVGHHGSRTSTSLLLLEHWRPHIALISAGRGNSFGHPTPDVLGRLESIGARVYRTDRDGQITLETDCTRVSVRAFNDERR